MDHAIKEAVVRGYAQRYELRTLIESGTWHGEMIRPMLNTFTAIYSIEISPGLYGENRQRFANNANVRLFCGDSAEVLPSLLKEITGPALFWLDGHFSGVGTAKGSVETPILAELESIDKSAQQKRAVILIDDASLYNGQGDWPSLQQLSRRLSDRHFEIEDDIIRITPS